jgi:putative transposase
MRTRRPAHLRFFDYLGYQRYFLTFCTHGRRHAFMTPDHVDIVWTQIMRAASREQFAVIAYCFMRDHLHLLIEALLEASDCRRFIALAKQLSGYHYREQVGVRLWQRYGYERTLRDGEGSLAVTRYILENPVRAGLVARPDEYPFVGSTVYSIAELFEAVQFSVDWRHGVAGPAEGGRHVRVRPKADPTYDRPGSG